MGDALLICAVKFSLVVRGSCENQRATVVLGRWGGMQAHPESWIAYLLHSYSLLLILVASLRN